MEDDMRHRIATAVVTLLLTAAPAIASGGTPPARMDVLVDGTPRPKFSALGTTYIEALRSREYQIRLDNPSPVRVAVALSVDGLNTIDARHTTAAAARKWVIEPYGTITISGWQTSLSDARRFQFTTEERSYGQMLGRTTDLGVISAVFFRERPRVVELQPLIDGRDQAKREEARRQGEPAMPAPSQQGGVGAAAASRQAAEANDYAATGLGSWTDHAVREVHLELESVPAASVSLRYEYRPQLVRLGVLRDVVRPEDPLDRRQQARGFAPGFCPDPKR
jgi:hypothetical protein